MIDRRRFIRTGAIAAAGTAGLAAPAIAQSLPRIQWRCASAFPKSLDTIYAGADELAAFVRDATDGAFQIQPFGAGEIAPAAQAADAVVGGTVQMCQTASSYYVDKDPAYALGAAVPFALNSRGMNAWLYSGGGIDLLNEYFGGQGLHYLPGGNTGTQMGGWFRREINATQDLKGLRMRVSGLAAQVLGRLGVLPQQLDVGDIRPGLEGGTIDAAEWIGPYDDEKLGLVKVAPFYYYPGWWEGSLTLCFFVNNAEYEKLPAAYRSLLATAARAVSIGMQAKYDFQNPSALKRLVAAGAQLRPFPQDVLNASFDAANQIYGDINGRNAPFKKIFDSMMAFRAETYLYQQVPEYTFDTFMMIKQREGALGGK